MSQNSDHFRTLFEALHNPARLRALRALDLLDSPAEDAFDRLADLAGRLLRAPVALVSLVEDDRQFFKSCLGLPEPWSRWRQTPLSHSFCQHVVATGEPLVIGDARVHPLVKDNLAVRELNVVAYLGIPLTTPDGHVLGSFCVTDSVPRQWSGDDVHILRTLAASVITEIELRRQRVLLQEMVRQRTQELERANHELELANGQLASANASLGAANNLLRDEVAAHRRDLERALRGRGPAST